jgi:SAM-dependent methyltransferase
MITTAILDWERLWAPYDEPIYHEVLAHARPDDVVLEIGAGDLRLARRLAKRARRVYALEVQSPLIARALAAMDDVPDNLEVICADARHTPFPPEVTLGVLLMRHCRHFCVYANKLAAVGCERLVTNARWGFGMEIIHLSAPRVPFDSVPIGWYACWCGATGFIPGPPEWLTPALEATVHQVITCPSCK